MHKYLLRWIKDHNIRPGTLKLQAEKGGGILQDISICTYFLCEQKMRQITNESELMELKPSMQLKKIFIPCIDNLLSTIHLTLLISGIYKIQKKLSTKRKSSNKGFWNVNVF